MRPYHPPCVLNSPPSALVVRSQDDFVWYRHNFHLINGCESVCAILLPCSEAFARIQFIQEDTTVITLDTRFHAFWRDHTSVIRGHPPQLKVHIVRSWRSFVQIPLPFTQPLVVRVDVSHPGPVSLSISLNTPSTTPTPTPTQTANQANTNQTPPPTRVSVINTNVYLTTTVPLASPVPPVLSVPLTSSTPPMPAPVSTVPLLSRVPLQATQAPTSTPNTSTSTSTEPNNTTTRGHALGDATNQKTLVKNIVTMSIDSRMAATAFEEARNIHGLFFDLDYFCPVRIYGHGLNQSQHDGQDYVDYTSPLQFLLMEHVTDQRFRAYLPLTNFHDSWSVFTLVHEPTIQLLSPLHPVSGQVFAMSLSLVDLGCSVQTSNHQDMIEHYNQLNRPGAFMSSLAQFINRVTETTQSIIERNAEQATDTQQSVSTNIPPPPASLTDRSQAIHRPLLGDASESTNTENTSENANRTCNITLREIEVDHFYTICPQCTKIFDLDAFLTWWRINPTCPTCRHADPQSWQCYRNSIMRLSQDDNDSMDSSMNSSVSSDSTPSRDNSPHSNMNRVREPESDLPPSDHPPPRLTSALVLPIPSSPWSLTQGQSFFQSTLEISHGEDFDLDMFETETFFFEIPNPSDDSA